MRAEDDYARWSDWVVALREASPRIVGICRSQNRPGLRVAAEDRNLIERLMPGSASPPSSRFSKAS
jgi:hypothetical protein